MPDKKKDIPISELIELEYTRCEADPVYFIQKYVFIQAEDGRMKFSMYDFQKKLTQLFRNDKYKRISILKSRQIGITTLCAAFSLWYILFKADQSIVCLAPTQKKAKIILDKVKFAYDNLPSWILRRHPYVNKNELSLILKNGSKIEAASGDSDFARGFTAHILFLDEAAFIENAESLWSAANSTLDTTDGLAVILSTPNGVGNWFHKKHTEAITKSPKTDADKKKTFVPVYLPWNMIPGRDQAWRDEKTKEHGEREARQEYDCDFLASGDTVIPPDIIDWYEKNCQRNPIEMRGVLNDTWIFKNAEQGHDYALISDVARGDGSDKSTIQIIDLFTNEQVAEYEGLIDTDDFPNLIVSLGYEYNEALVIIERESIGWAVVKDAVATRYKNLYYSPKEGMVMDAETYLNRNYDNDTSKMVPGFSTNVKFRPLVVDSFRSMIEKKALIIRSKRTIDQMRVFIWFPNGKAKAQKGFNDDLIIPVGIYGFLRDTAIRFSREGKNMTMATLQHYGMKRETIFKKQEPGVITNEHTRQIEGQPRQVIMPKVNPFRYKVGRNEEDCSWLL